MRTRQIFPIIDERIRSVGQTCAKEGEPIQCGPGCSECCYLLPAVTWEEASLLADWIMELPAPKRASMIGRVTDRAAHMRALALSRPSWSAFSRPTRTQKEIPDSLCNEYFLTSRGCPFLINKSCSAYSVRPTVCRLYVVTSKRSECSRKTGLEGQVVTPAPIERLQKKILTEAQKFARDGRWGQLAVMVEAVLLEKTSAQSAAA